MDNATLERYPAAMQETIRKKQAELATWPVDKLVHLAANSLRMKLSPAYQQEALAELSAKRPNFTNEHLIHMNDIVYDIVLTELEKRNGV